MCSIKMWFLSQMIFTYVQIAFLPGIFVAEFLVVAILIFPGNLYQVSRTGSINNWIWEWVMRLIDEIVVVQLTMYQILFCGVWNISRCLYCLMHIISYEFYYFPFVCFNYPHIPLYWKHLWLLQTQIETGRNCYITLINCIFQENV